jgi:hypothetical protein
MCVQVTGLQTRVNALQQQNDEYKRQTRKWEQEKDDLERHLRIAQAHIPELSAEVEHYQENLILTKEQHEQHLQQLYLLRCLTPLPCLLPSSFALISPCSSPSHSAESEQRLKQQLRDIQSELKSKALQAAQSVGPDGSADAAANGGGGGARRDSLSLPPTEAQAELIKQNNHLLHEVAQLKAQLLAAGSGTGSNRGIRKDMRSASPLHAASPTSTASASAAAALPALPSTAEAGEERYKKLWSEAEDLRKRLEEATQTAQRLNAQLEAVQTTTQTKKHQSREGVRHLIFFC